MTRPAKRSKPNKTADEVLAARRAYQRLYYQLHREKAKGYQRLYNLRHKKSRGGKKHLFVCPREATRSTYNTCDLMNAPVEKVIAMLDKILAGERLFTL